MTAQHDSLETLRVRRRLGMERCVCRTATGLRRWMSALASASPRFVALNEALKTRLFHSMRSSLRTASRLKSQAFTVEIGIF